MGEVFAGRYELLDPIAAGGMGKVLWWLPSAAKRYVAD